MTPTAQLARPWVVFADDWGRHPSSCQHLVRHILPHRPVVWVHTIGTRPPRFDWSTAARAVGKLREWVRPRSHPPGASESISTSRTGPQIVAPKMWPSFRSRFGRRLNRTLMLRTLGPVIEALPQPPDVVTTLPLVADLIGHLTVHRWVYYCVDDFSVWPGYDGETMLRMERELVPRADTVVAVSDTLVEHISRLEKPAHLLTHGVDLDHWSAPPAGTVSEFPGLAPPLVVFWGVIDRRTDISFVRHLTANMTAGTLVLVGPQEDPDPELFRLPRVAIRPPMPFDRLPALAAAATVLVMPYTDSPVTRAMQPLKLKEYMATGRPVVVRDLPSTRSWADAVDVADTPEAFTAAVIARSDGVTPVSQQSARMRLAQEGWAGKAAVFEKLVCGEESSPPGEIRATVG